jgi:NAD(P) transhydrogenase
MEVGGVCVHPGTIPSKTFREAVLALTNVHNGRIGAWTMRPSAADLVARVDEIVTREVRVQADQLRRNGIAVIEGCAEFADPHALVIRSSQGERRVTSDRFLVAVGTTAVRPADVPADMKCVITSDDVLTLPDLPRTMVVIGCGVIGMEYASMFSALGVKVQMVDARSQPLEFIDTEIVDELVHQMRSRMVTFRFGEAVARIECRGGSQDEAVVHLQSGKRLVADLALTSTGRQGASAPLKLDRAGLAADERGRLKVDDKFRTGVPYIYAAGDIIGYPSLAATSSEQGRLAACHAFGVAAGPMPAHFPIGIYSIPELSMAGATEKELTAQKVPYETGLARYREIARGQILGDDSGMLKLVFHAETRKLLGVHAIGTGATELVHIGQAVLALGGGLDYFLQNVFNYPTLAECYKVAALDVSNKLAA